MRVIASLIAMLVLTACNISTSRLLSDKGHTMAVRYRDGEGGQWIFYDNRAVEGFLAVFRLAVPLDTEGPAESTTDMIFTYRVDGKEVSKFILCRDGELFHDGQWFVVDKDWLYRWQSKYDPKNSRRPNQALQHNDPSCHESCLRTPRASRGRG